jgi:hypothetical protein
MILSVSHDSLTDSLNNSLDNSLGSQDYALFDGKLHSVSPDVVILIIEVVHPFLAANKAGPAPHKVSDNPSSFKAHY